MSLKFEHLFKLSMDRDLPQLLEPPPGLVVGLGESGVKKTGRVSLGLPDWCWPRDPLPFEDESVGIFHAYHFLEHLTGEDAMRMLKAMSDKLVTGGIVQFCIPHWSAEIAAQDLTHKSFWSEQSFKTIFNNQYYDPTNGMGIKLRVHYLVIAGIVQRNLCIMGQLVKA